jgi:DNA-binding MarR family transcriptional regulator
MFDSPDAVDSILPLGRSLGNSLRHVNRLIQRDLGVRIAPLGISLGQWYALRTLWISDGLTQIELAQKSGVAGPAMVMAVRSLLSMGLVVRRRHSSDQRKYLISLTEKGRRLEAPALQAAIDANAAATVNIDPREVEICMRVLRQAHQNLAANVGAFDSNTDLDAIIA